MSIRTLHIPVEGPLQVVELPQHDIVKLGELVGGHFQCVPLANEIGLWVNEDGKGLGLPHNPRAQVLWDRSFGARTDLIVGPAVLTDGVDDNGNTLGITDEQLVVVEAALEVTRVRIENTYEDGHSSTIDVWVDNPAAFDEASLEDWWDEEVSIHTGDGHGAEHPDLGSIHDCTVISGPAEMIGKTYGWGG